MLCGDSGKSEPIGMAKVDSVNTKTPIMSSPPIAEFKKSIVNPPFLSAVVFVFI